MYEYNEKLLNQLGLIHTSQELKKFIKENHAQLDPFLWYKITESKAFKFSIINDDDIESLSWEHISMSFNLSDEELEKYAFYLNWYCISCFQKLSIAFIKKYADELSLDKLRDNDKLDDSTKIFVERLYREKNDMPHHLIWANNLKNSRTFRPNMPKKSGKEEIEKNLRIIPSVDVINGMQKDEIKHFLDKFNIKYLYKNTIYELRNKFLNYRDELLLKLKVPEEEYDKFLLDQINKKNPIEEKIVEEVVKVDVTNNEKKTKNKKKKLDYSKMSKKELKEILNKRKVRVFYHDTLEILRKKCEDSENVYP